MKLASIVMLGLLLGWWFSPWRGGEAPPAQVGHSLPDLADQAPVFGMKEGRVMSIRFQQPGALADADLIGLAHYADLEVLDLRGAAITDTGLNHLRWLARLRELYLDGTRVTARGVSRLASELPNCDVWWRGRNWNAGRPRAVPEALEIHASI